MKVLTFKADDGTKITFDEYTHEEEYNYYWITMCEKCLGKYRKHLGSRVQDHGGGCCSICGCDTPDEDGNCYVDFNEDEVKEMED